MDYLTRIAYALYENDISFFFCLLIVVYLITSIILSLSNTQNAKLRTLIELTPGFVTSLGILGTFSGIFIGLLDFNQNNLTESLPELLEGLKVAFGTSIVGLSAAIIFRVSRPFITRDSFSTGVGADEIHQEMVSTNKQMGELVHAVTKSEETTKAGLETLQRAITDDNDSSICGQLQRLRASMGDLEKATRAGFEEQIKEFRDFAGHMSKAFSEAIIEELKSVIREFNEKISEQFGENFKQLNVAVGRLLEWQENYKTQIERTQDSIKQAVSAIQSTQKSLGKIERSVSTIPGFLEKMGDVNERLNDNVLALNQGISSISEMRDKAENAFPAISDKIDKLAESVTESVEAQQKSTEKTVNTVGSMASEIKGAVEGTRTEIESAVTGLSEAVKSVLTEQKKAQATMLQEIEESLKRAQTELNQAISEMGKNLESSLSDQKSAQQQLLEGLQSSFTETMNNISTNLNDSIKTLDTAMQTEIESVVSTMAENLAGITQHFVDDYTPLLEQSRKIVELAQQAEGR